MSPTAEPALLQHVTAAAAHVANAGSNLDEETRKKTLKAAMKLVAALEKPQEVLWRYTFRVSLALHDLSTPSSQCFLTSVEQLSSERMAMRMGLEMGLYGVLARVQGKPVSAQELADACKAEKLFTGM